MQYLSDRDTSSVHLHKGYIDFFLISKENLMKTFIYTHGEF